MSPKQEEALRDYLQEAIVPLIEQILVKKLGQAMTFAAEQLVQPKREWQGLTDDEMNDCWDSPLTPLGMKHARMIEDKLRRKNT